MLNQLKALEWGRRCLQPSLFSIAFPTYGCDGEANTSRASKKIFTLIDIQKKKSLCDKTKLKNLYEYVTTRTIICQTNHKNPCTTCAPLLNIAKQIITSGHMQLSHAFKSAYPAQTYKTDIALA